MTTRVQDAIKRNGRTPNAYDVESIGKSVVPLLRQDFARAHSPEELREVLGEVLDLLGLIVGSAADGARAGAHASAYAAELSGRGSGR